MRLCNNSKEKKRKERQRIEKKATMASEGDGAIASHFQSGSSSQSTVHYSTRFSNPMVSFLTFLFETEKQGVKKRDVKGYMKKRKDDEKKEW